MTARDRLTRNIGLYGPLSESDVEDIIDQELATRDDFEPSVDPFASDDDPPTFAYRGSRWGVEFRGGRPHLVEAIDMPPRTAVAETEHAFALVVDMLEQMWSTPMTDEQIAEIRDDGWAETFRHAAERDATRTGQGDETPEATRPDDGLDATADTDVEGGDPDEEG